MANEEIWRPAQESEMGRLIYAKDWSETPLGDQKDWPQSLQSVLKMCLVSNSPTGLCWGDDLLFFYNDAWSKILGDKHPSSLGKPARQVFEENWQKFDSYFAEVLSTGEVRKSNNQLLSFSNGKENYFDFSFNPIPDENGEVGGVYVTAAEVPEFGQAIDKSQIDPAQFRNMIDALPTAIYTTDTEGRLTHFNQAAADFSGRKPELGTDRWCVTWKLYYPDGTPMPHEECPMAISLKEERSINGAEAIAETPDGERKWFKAYPSPLRNDEGEITGSINMLVDVTEQKKMEEKIRRNQQELTDFFKNANVGIHWVRSDGIIKKANQAELNMLGYTREEYEGSHIADFHADEDVIDDILTRLTNREELKDYEVRLQCKDGTIKYALINSSVYEENGEFIHTRCITRDITDRKKIEQALREKEKKYRTVVENFPKGGVGLFDKDLRYTAAGGEIIDQMGTNLEDRIGKKISDIYPEEMISEYLPYFKAVFDGEENSFEAEFRDRYFFAHVLPVENDEGEVISGMLVVQDISERWQAQQELRESEAKFRMIAENLNEVIWMASADSEEFIYINPAFEKVWGLDREKLFEEPLSFLDLIHPDDRERIREKYAALPEEEMDEEYRIIKPDGEVRWIYSRAFKIHHGEGEISRVIGISEDITERKKHERDLQKSEEKYRTLFESIDEGFCILKMLFDEDENPVNYRYLETNPAYEQHTGLKDVEGKTAQEVLPDMEESWYEKHGKVALTGEPERFEGYNKELQRWFNVYSFPFGNPREQKVAVIFKDITERKENEISNAYLSAIVENSDDAIISKDLEGNITSWNDSAERIFGYTADEAVGRHITLIIPDNRIDEEDEILSQLKQGDKIDHFETKRQHKDGTLLDISLTISPVRNAEGEIVGASKIARDITQRKEAEQKLIKNRNRLRTALEIETVGVLFWGGEDFTITEVNDAFLNMSGYSREEIMGKSWREMTPEEFYPVSEQGVADLKKTGQPEPYEKQYIRKDGSRWWGLCAPRRINDNEVVEFLLDITERKEAEQEREQLLKKVETEKERLSDIFKQAPSFMCILRGPDHVFERANDYYREVVGDRPLIGKPVAEAIPEAEGQGFFELLDEVYETGESFRANEMSVELKRQPGKPAEELFVDFVYQPIRDPEGTINGIFVQGVDLTERHYVKEELKAINETLEERVAERTKKLRSYQKQLRSLTSQLNKAEERERQRLASELHDKLGQMLAVAKMKTDGLQHDQVFDQKTAEVEELKQVLDDALKYNQNLMTELKPPPVLDKEDITEVLYWTVKKVEKQGLDIVVKDDGQPKPVEKDIRTMLHQSVRELLQNVIKHADVNEARLVMSRENGQVKITVEDEGRGFDLSEERLTPTEEGRFGLFNIRERMDWHGGTFEIHSEPGKGTTAILCAPLKEKNKSDEPVRKKQLSPPADIAEEQVELWQKINVLLVDDHEMVRRGLRQMIEKQDDLAIVAEASNGKEAIELAHETSPDVIVMDVNMPVVDGIEATHKIKAEMPNIRIIGLSLHDSEEVIQDMRSAGASDYLTKDEAFETLCITIRNEAAKVQK